MAAINRFVTTQCSLKPTNCPYCHLKLKRDESLFGHGQHKFHESCCLSMIHLTRCTQLPCPEKGCSFVATHINDFLLENYGSSDKCVPGFM